MSEPTEERAPLYRSVADHVESLIDEGTLPPGTRIPSLRKLSRHLSVSVTTVMEEYRVLEDRGVVEVRPQSGHYVRLDTDTSPPEPMRTRTCVEPATLDAAEVIQRLVREASEPGLTLPLGAAVPDASFLPTARLNTFLARAVRRDPVASQSYGSVAGREELRVEIVRRALDAGCALAPDDVVITTGAMEAINLALRAVTRPGDTVAIETPTSHGFLLALESLHLKTIEIATCPRDGACLECLEEAIEQQDVKAFLSVPTFGNPLGHNMPVDLRRDLVAMLAQHDIPMIEDDTYGDLPFDGARPPAVQSMDPDGRVLLLSSFSKMLAPGFRVGWIAPGRYRKEVLRHKISASLATAAPTQMAIADYLAAGGVDRHLRRLRRTFKDLTRRMIAAVAEYFPPGTRASRPAGGYVLWVELPEGTEAFPIYRQALAEGISLIPGPIFSATGRYRNALRFNCAIPWTNEVETAVARVGALAHQATAD